jgi:hypothetical protein
MKLIFLYGPPAVGKLTVAQELAALTGYKVFHNHLTFDYAAALFEPFTPPFWALCNELRRMTIALAAKHGLEGLVFTYCYAYPDDDAYVARIRTIVESASGEVHFVQLLCDLEELTQRVIAPDRQEFGKLTSPQGLQETLSRYDLFTPIPNSDTLCIDNTQLGPRQAAEQIIDHFGLSE